MDFYSRRVPRWDELISRVESGEEFQLINEDGQAAVMMPAEEYREAKSWLESTQNMMKRRID